MVLHKRPFLGNDKKKLKPKQKIPGKKNHKKMKIKRYNPGDQFELNFQATYPQ